MNDLVEKITNLPIKQKVLLLSIFAAFLLLGITLTSVQQKQEIRPKAAEEVRDPTACLSIPTTDTFEGATPSMQLWNRQTSGTALLDVTQSGGMLKTSVTQIRNGFAPPSESFAGLITKKKVCGDFDVRVDFSQFSSSQSGDAVAFVSVEEVESNSAVYMQLVNRGKVQGYETNIKLNGVWQNQSTFISSAVTSGKLRIKRQGTIFSAYYEENSSWKLLGAHTNGFNKDANILIGVGSWLPELPDVSANFDNFSLREPIPDPTFTPVPSPTPTPSISPTPTPPSGEEKYTIDVGDKQYLLFNIGPGQTPQIRFKARLSQLSNKPQMFLKLRLKDELAFINNPTAINSGDSCNNPPPGTYDFYVPVTPEGEDYVPVPDINGPPPGGNKAAVVTPDGWVSLDGVVAGKYYTLYLKGPKTRSTKVAEHIMLQPDKNTSLQDFNWTEKPLDPGDLPDPNNGLRQDCTVNSIDLSLITSRLGATDGDNLNIGDVNYDGVINGNDVSKVVNTLSTKPDDDL